MVVGPASQRGEYRKYVIRFKMLYSCKGRDFSLQAACSHRVEAEEEETPPTLASSSLRSRRLGTEPQDPELAPAPEAQMRNHFLFLFLPLLPCCRSPSGPRSDP